MVVPTTEDNKVMFMFFFFSLLFYLVLQYSTVHWYLLASKYEGQIIDYTLPSAFTGWKKQPWCTVLKSFDTEALTALREWTSEKYF